MWKWRDGPRPKTLLLCALCALLGIAGGTDRAPAADRGATAQPRAHAVQVDGPQARTRLREVAERVPHATIGPSPDRSKPSELDV